MKEKNQVVPDEMLSKEFLSQFKTEADVSKFLKQLHAQVLEKMLEGEIFRQRTKNPKKYKDKTNRQPYHSFYKKLPGAKLQIKNKSNKCLNNIIRYKN